MSTFVETFVSQVAEAVSLDDALAPAIESETDLRRLFATDRKNPKLTNPFIGLVDVFATHSSIRLTQARKVQDEQDLNAHHVFPLPEEKRRADGEPAMAANLDDFKTAFNIFSEGSLSQLTDWDNVVVAGGSVLACLAPLPKDAQKTKRGIRKYFHGEGYPNSDIDMFIYGLTPEQAEKKAIQIYDAVRDSVPWDTVCVRTKNALSIHSQYPYRPVQIILRLYHSPAEILAGFDIDSTCFAYDSKTVWGNPRSIVSLMRQANTVDVTRRSPSYEVRLAKYSTRGFEVKVPTLRRASIDPTIFERSIQRIEGMARLLVLEKLSDPFDRQRYLENRRQLRGRPQNPGYSRRATRRRRKLNGDLRAEADAFGGLSGSDYGTQAFHLPYGPKFVAAKVGKLIYQTDLGMNSTFNPKNKDRRLHRHPAFFGTMPEVLEDCCRYCPEPVTEEEIKLQEAEDAQHVRGHVSWMTDDPGRQLLTSSFHPINDGEWAVQAYLGATEKLFKAIADNDRETVGDILRSEGIDLRVRDHVGRTCLHLALLARRVDIALDLIDAGARITARLVDGRTALHLAAQHGLDVVVTKLLERSQANEKAEEEKKAAEEKAKATAETSGSEMESDNETARASSDDDWDSDKDTEENPQQKKTVKVAKQDMPTVNDSPAEGADLPEDNEELPDILDIHAVDWDLNWSPLVHAIVGGHCDVVDILLRAGADARTPWKTNESYNQRTIYPLSMAIYNEDEKSACRIVERLLEAGASSTASDNSLVSVLHSAVNANALAVVRTMLRVDPNAITAVNFLARPGYNQAILPLVTAITLTNRPMVALLLAYGSITSITEKDFDKSWDVSYAQNTNRYRPQKRPNQWLIDTYMPLETAISRRSDALPLIKLGSDPNLSLRDENGYRSYTTNRRKTTMLDAVRTALEATHESLKWYEDRVNNPPKEKTNTPWSYWNEQKDSFRAWLAETTLKPYIEIKVKEQEEKALKEKVRAEKETKMNLELSLARCQSLIKYFEEIERALIDCGAKTWAELNPAEAAAQENLKRIITPQPLPPLATLTHALPPPLATQAHALLPPLATQTQTLLPPLATQNATDSEEFLAKHYKTSSVPISFIIFREQWLHEEPAPAHTIPLYEELFEACWKGNNERIKELCLPPKTGKRNNDTEYLQITCEVRFNPSIPVPPCLSDNVGAEISSFKEYPCGAQEIVCFTPLRVAILSRNWETTKIIIAIAKAQYEAPASATTYNNHCSECCDEEYDEDSDIEVDDDIADELNRKAEIMDISNRISTVRVPVGPSALFRVAPHLINGKVLHQTPLAAAVQAGDVGAAKQIFSLHKLCESSLPLNPHMELNNILRGDSPAMLDLFIRKFGIGLGFSEEEEDDPQGAEAIKKMPKTYLGLDVHGVKRKDLAKKNDPNAPRRVYQPHHIPLLWSAATVSATKIVDWLATPAPLEAYKAFMSSASEEDTIAKALTKIKDMEIQLPDLLGFLPNEFGETAVFATLFGQHEKNLAIVKQLYKLSPHMKNTFTGSRVKGVEMTPILLVCAINCHKDLFDFFLSHGANPMDVDHRGYNILHTMCSDGHLELLQHVSQKLTKEQMSILISQQSQVYRNTPIMLAVKGSRPHVVDLMLSVDNPATAASLCLRDVQGSLPLHIAVKSGLNRITASLLQFSEPRLLYTEDGVGITPLEIASLQHLLRFTGSEGAVGSAVAWRCPPKITYPISDKIPKYSEDVERPKIEAAETLSALVQSLDAEGRFTNKEDLKDVLTDYAERTMKIARQQSEKQAEETIPEPQTNLGLQTESPDKVGTFKLIRNAVGHSTRRELVHPLDAQRAVGNALDKAISQHQKYPGYGAVDELGEETVKKDRIRRDFVRIWCPESRLYDKEQA